MGRGIKDADTFQDRIQPSTSKVHTRRWASNEELAWPVANDIQFFTVPQSSPAALTSLPLQGTTVRRGQEIHKDSHNLPFTLPTSNFCVLGKVYFKLSLNKIIPWPSLSSSSAPLTKTRFPGTTVAISPAVHSTSTSSLIHMYSQNHCAHRDQFIFPSPVAPFGLCRKKLAASNKERYE